MKQRWTNEDWTAWVWTMEGKTVRCISEMLFITKFKSCGNSSDTKELYISRNAKSPLHPILDLVPRKNNVWNDNQGMCSCLITSALEWRTVRYLELETWRGIVCCLVMKGNVFLQIVLSKFFPVSSVTIFRSFEVQAYYCLTMKLECSNGEANNITIVFESLSNVWHRRCNFNFLTSCWQFGPNKRQNDVLNSLTYDLLPSKSLVYQPIQ